VQFATISEAFAMGGHGVYVWFVFSVALLTAVALLVVPTVRNRRIEQDLLGAIKRQNRAAQGGEHAPGS
jgi:heme exporter protein CcmD